MNSHTKVRSRLVVIRASKLQKHLLQPQDKRNSNGNTHVFGILLFIDGGEKPCMTKPKSKFQDDDRQAGNTHISLRRHDSNTISTDIHVFGVGQVNEANLNHGILFTRSREFKMAVAKPE
jgi:hypothetical protein